MLSLDELFTPITLDAFMADYHGRKPLHIAAVSGDRAGLLGWADFNAMLSRTSSWNAANLRMVRDNKPVPPEQFCSLVQTQSGSSLRPAPDKVEVLLSTGASLIANDVQEMHPALADLAARLSRQFAASVGANIYCSFGGVQAFGTHYDLHDVFALHLEGEKTWRLYQSRAQEPVAMPQDIPDVRQWFQQTRGPLMQEVTMRPGDVLYLPRGWYHDALADGEASLHVTFSVSPLHGRVLFGLLESAAMQDPAFRRYLPSAHEDGGRALQRRLAELGQMLAALSASPAFRDEIAMAQERLIPRPPTYALPDRKPLTLFTRTGRPSPVFAGPVSAAMEWALAQTRFALEDICARFDFVDPAEIRAAVAAAEKAGALSRA